MDPLTRGSLFHKVQAEFYRALQSERRAAGHAATALPRRSQTLDAVLDRVAGGVRREAGAGDRARLARRDRRAAARPRHLGAEARRRSGLGPDLLRVQLRPERRGTRSAQPAGSGPGRRPLRAARLGRSDRASRRRRRAARHRSQDRQEPLEPGSRRRRRRDAAAGALQRWRRAGAGQEGRRGPAVLLHDRRRLRRARRFRSTTTRAARGCRC